MAQYHPFCAKRLRNSLKIAVFDGFSDFRDSWACREIMPSLTMASRKLITADFLWRRAEQLKISKLTSGLAELSNLPALTPAEQRQHSNHLRLRPCNGTGPFSPPKAGACNQKTEVNEGAEALPTDFFNDLQCLCQHECPFFQWVTIKSASVTTEAKNSQLQACVQPI
jgi:hypothetical protein